MLHIAVLIVAKLAAIVPAVLDTVNAFPRRHTELT
jgi:hypothetical protein